MGEVGIFSYWCRSWLNSIFPIYMDVIAMKEMLAFLMFLAGILLGAGLTLLFIEVMK